MQPIFKLNRNTFSLVLLTAVLFFASCKKDDNPNPNPTPPPAPKIQEFKDGDDFMKFEYNADGTLKKATVKNEINTSNEIVDFNVTYNANKVITEVNSTSGEKIVPVYENSKLVRADIFMGGHRTGYTSYHFEGGNIHTATIYVEAGDNDYVPILEFRYNFNAAGNINEGIILVASDQANTLVRAGSVELEYDAKPNPLYELKDFLALLWQGASKNNVVLEKVFDSQLQLEDRSTYTYTYKANGFPEKADVKTGLPGQPEELSTVGFTYR